MRSDQTLPRVPAQTGIVLTLLGFFGLLYAIMKLRNSAWGLAGLLPRQLVLHRPKE